MKKIKNYFLLVLILAVSCFFLMEDSITAEAANTDFYKKYSDYNVSWISFDEDFILNYKCKLTIKMEFPNNVDFEELEVTIDRIDEDEDEDGDVYEDEEYVFDEDLSLESSPYIKTITLPAGEYAVFINGDVSDEEYWEEKEEVEKRPSCWYSLTLTGEYIPELSNKSITLEEGKTKALKVKGPKKSVTWKSSNKKAATVNNEGVVKAKKAGKATITAKCGKHSLTCKVTVKKKPVTYGQMAKKMKTFARKNKYFTYKTIDVGKECRLYARSVADSDTSKIDSKGYSMGMDVGPYIQLVKKNNKTELRLRMQGHILEYSIYPTRLACSKLKLTTSNRRLNYTMKQTYGRNSYNYATGIYAGEITGYATLSASSKKNTTSLKKFNTMLGQKSLFLRMTSGDGAYYQFGIPTKARKEWKKLVNEYNTLLKEY